MVILVSIRDMLVSGVWFTVLKSRMTIGFSFSYAPIINSIASLYFQAHIKNAMITEI